jgi:hypothetical protein
VLNDDILDNSVLLTTPFRYDRAYVDITYTNNQGERVTEKCVNPDIMMEGGRAPAHCKFDLGNMEYRCAYSFGEKGWMEFVGEPTIEPELHLGEPIIVKGKINKQSASSENENMSVRFRIYDEDGGDYLKNIGYIMIPNEGETDLESLFPEIKVTDSLFGSLGRPAITTSDNLDGITPEVTSGNLRTDVVVTFTKSGDNYKYNITSDNVSQNSGNFSSPLTFTVTADDETATIKIAGSPVLSDDTAAGTVTISQVIGKSGLTVPRSLILEISLHYDTESTPISYGGEEQVKKLNFEILSSKKD